MPTSFVSLWDMLQVNADRFLMLGQALSLLQTPPGEPEQPASNAWQKSILASATRVQETSLALGLNVTAGITARRLKEYESTVPTRGKMAADFTSLTECIEEELRDRWFLYLESARVGYYEHGPNPFGEDVSINGFGG